MTWFGKKTPDKNNAHYFFALQEQLPSTNTCLRIYTIRTEQGKELNLLTTPNSTIIEPAYTLRTVHEETIPLRLRKNGSVNNHANEFFPPETRVHSTPYKALEVINNFHSIKGEVTFSAYIALEDFLIDLHDKHLRSSRSQQAKSVFINAYEQAFNQLQDPVEAPVAANEFFYAANSNPRDMRETKDDFFALLK
ncbi:MAG: hypothetical protein ACMXYD_03465 [Candidatus Woesearchaeota archaeon]